MERIRDINNVRKGDFVSFKGTLSLVASVELKEDFYVLTLDTGEIIEKKPGEHMEFFRTLERFK